ncbi:hypothetical protein TNCV_3673351 [Trichonephila clavipes]|nr:hypothetical protein TNCV_3673351 [Trichonephila clavipes]
MSTLKNSMLELAAKFDDNYNTGLIKSFMFGLNKTEIKTMTDILSRYKFRDSHGYSNKISRIETVLPQNLGYSRRAESPIVMLVERKERWEAPDPPECSSSKLGLTQQIHTVTCIVLKAKANDRRKNLASSRDEFCTP